MAYHQIKIIILLMFLPLFINGCMGMVGGTCKYDTITSHAVVEEIKNDENLGKYYLGEHFTVELYG